MRREGIQARPPRRKLPKDTGQPPTPALAPNTLDRRFRAGRPNHRWSADFTYIWATEGWLYVALVIGLFSRRVVGWSMKNRMKADLVTDALMMAIWRRGPADKLLHHSDQGSQYASNQFQRRLDAHGIECSMSRRGDCWDNAAVESFFASLKAERVERKTYRSRDEIRADVFDYIERFYNPRRRHSTPGYLSPMEYEKQAALA
jgi:putative transposase